MFRNMTDTRLRLLIAVALIAITTAAYWPVLGNGFVNYDDDRYVYHNPRVQDGLSLDRLQWALTSTSNSNWHPLTWISHMADCQVYGLKPTGHHLTSLLLHLANTLLLFLFLTRLTGLPWRSGFVAALFAVHPLHVESVAWVAERKDVLSTFFLLLTLLAYVRYTKSPSIKRYLPVAGAFILGLMAKPMLVSLPIVLMLLDYWPLRRFSQESRTKKQPVSGRLIIEKIPLFILALGSCTITLIAQRAGGAMNPLEEVSVGVRITTAVAACAAYIGQMLWPLRLGVIYPHPGGEMPVWQIIGSALLLSGISYFVYRHRQSRPYLIFGWLWYVITLVPVIGLVQVGSQFIADRYTYVPLIGLFAGIAWGVAEWNMSTSTSRSTRMGEDGTPTRPYSHTPTLIPAAIVMVLLGIGTFRQVGCWKDSYTLFSHTLEVTAPSPSAHTNLAVALVEKGDYDEAIKHYRMALDIDPGHANTHYNLGNALIHKKMHEEAVEHYEEAIARGYDTVDVHRSLADAYAAIQLYEQAEEEYLRALRIDPEHLPALANVGKLYKDTGRFGDAERIYRKTVEMRPQDADAHSDLGVALAAQGMLDEAMEEFQRALDIKPSSADAHANTANVYASRKEYARAIEEYRHAIRLEPGHLEAHYNLGLVLRQQRDIRGAVTEFRKAAEIKPSMPLLHNTLAAALYAAGDYPGAWIEVHLCEANGGRPEKQLVDMLSARLPDPGP